MSHPSLNPQYPSWLHVHSHTLLDPRPLLQPLLCVHARSLCILSISTRGNLSRNPPLPSQFHVPPPMTPIFAVQHA
ncbi:hypothetical protein V2W45_290738 [Cenococcum geophilum]